MDQPDTATEPLFLWGADMEPGSICRRWPGARFVARAAWKAASVSAAHREVGTTWGILIRVPDVGARCEGGPSVVVMTDDGRALPARPASAAASLADPVAVLAAARYWELPPEYVARLVTATPVDMAPPGS